MDLLASLPWNNVKNVKFLFFPNLDDNWNVSGLVCGQITKLNYCSALKGFELIPLPCHGTFMFIYKIILNTIDKVKSSLVDNFKVCNIFIVYIVIEVTRYCLQVLCNIAIFVQFEKTEIAFFSYSLKRSVSIYWILLVNFQFDVCILYFVFHVGIIKISWMYLSEARGCTIFSEI